MKYLTKNTKVYRETIIVCNYCLSKHIQQSVHQHVFGFVQKNNMVERSNSRSLTTTNVHCDATVAKL